MFSHSLPIYCIIDGDPHGFQIYLNYKYGSKSMAYSSSFLAVPCVKFLGIAPSKWFTQLNIQKKDLIPCTTGDRKKCYSLLKNPHVCLDPVLKREICLILMYNYKSEIESVSITLLDQMIQSKTEIHLSGK